MDPSTLLAERLAIVFGVVMLSLAVGTVVHAITRVALDRAAVQSVKEGSDAVVMALTVGRTTGAITALRTLSRRRLFDVLLPFATRVSGGNEQSLADLAQLAGVEELGRKWRRSRRSWRRLHGARIGVLLGGPTDDIARLLDDRNSDVRAAAAEWAAKSPGLDTVDDLLRMLDDPSPGCSFAAMDSLVRLGTRVVPSLIVHLTSSDAEHILKCLVTAAHIADSHLGPAALSLVDHPDPAVRAGAANLLGVTGAGFATDQLYLMTLDSEPEVRAAAASALGRLHAWTSITAIRPLLGDRAWIVRKAAVLALLELGGPGKLMLRQAIDGEDRFASDIARLGLGLPPRAVEG